MKVPFCFTGGLANGSEQVDSAATTFCPAPRRKNPHYSHIKLPPFLKFLLFDLQISCIVFGSIINQLRSSDPYLIVHYTINSAKMGLKAVHFGGGNIGRGFVAEKLHESGYEVCIHH